MRQLSCHHHLQVCIAQCRQNDGHIAIYASHDVIHIHRLVDTHQEGLKTAVALHHRQELFTIYIHEDTCQGIIRHRFHITALDRTIVLCRLLQRLVDGFTKGESLTLNLQDAILYLHIGSDDHLRRIGILRSTQGKWSYKLLRQSLCLSHHSHRRREGLQTLVHRRNGDAILLFCFQILYHLLLELSLGISHHRPHHEERLTGEAHKPRILQYCEMKAFALLHFRSNALLGKRGKPVFHIPLIAHLGTETEVAIGTLEEIKFFRDIDATLIYIIHVEQRLEHTRLVFRILIGSHLLQIHRDKSCTFLRNGIEVIAARA